MTDQADTRNDAASTLRVYTIDDLLNMPPPQWMLEGWLQTQALHVTFGPSGHGKSLLALDWALSVASGRPWFGLEPVQGKVLYVIGEGKSGFSVRVPAWLEARSEDPTGDVLFTDTVNLLIPDHADELIDFIRDRGVTYTVIDTLAQNMVGGDENSARDVGIIVNVCRQAQDAGSAVNLIHHTGHTEQNRERGSYSIIAAADIRHKVKQDADGTITLTSVKVKDGQEPDPMSFQLRNVLDSVVLTPHDWRPTVLMDRVLEYVETSGGGVTTRQILDDVTGKRQYVRDAIDVLVGDGVLATEPGPHNSTRHYVKGNQGEIPY